MNENIVTAFDLTAEDKGLEGCAHASHNEIW